MVGGYFWTISHTEGIILAHFNFDNSPIFWRKCFPLWNHFFRFLDEIIFPCLIILNCLKMLSPKKRFSPKRAIFLIKTFSMFGTCHLQEKKITKKIYFLKLLHLVILTVENVISKEDIFPSKEKKWLSMLTGMGKKCYRKAWFFLFKCHTSYFTPPIGVRTDKCVKNIFKSLVRLKTCWASHLAWCALQCHHQGFGWHPDVFQCHQDVFNVERRQKINSYLFLVL